MKAKMAVLSWMPIKNGAMIPKKVDTTSQMVTVQSSLENKVLMLRPVLSSAYKYFHNEVSWMR